MSESPSTDPVSLPMDVKRKLLAARDALAAGDLMEAHHHIYSIASPHFNKLADEVWTALETPTPDSPGGAGTKPVQQWAVFCDSCEATWSVQHYHAGKARCEKCRRSSGEPEDLRAEVERLRVERYLCVLAMRCAMGAHHDGVDAMRERLEPVVARYGIATACAARAAISDADAACIEAQYSRSEIAGSSGEPVAKPNPCRNECSLISLDDDHWKCNHCDAVFAYTGAQKPVEKPRCWWPLCKETAGDALCDAVQSALTKGEKP